MADGIHLGSSARLGIPTTPSGSGSVASQSPTRQRSMSFTAYAGASASPVGPAAGAQRVIVIGAHDSGKTTTALHVFANEATAAAVGTDVVPSSTATVPGSGAGDAYSRGGDAVARPGRCVLRKHRLRRSAAAMDSSAAAAAAGGPSSPNFNLANADNNSIAGGSMVGSVAAPKVQTFNVDVIDAVVGAPSLVPVEVLELRDTDAAVLAGDRIFSRDVLTRQTAGIVVTVDCASLVCRPPTLKADDMETVVRGIANAGTGGGGGASTSPSRSPATRPADTAAASTTSTVKPSGGPPLAASKTDFLRLLETVDEERLRGVCLAQVRAAMDAAEAAHMDMEISSAARTVAHCVDALKRYHPCPPCCRVVVAVTKSDVAEGVCCARQLVLAEAARVGETYVKQRKAMLNKARGKAVTVLESRTEALARARGEGDSGLPRTAARAVDEKAAAADAKAFLARVQRRLLEAIDLLVNGSSSGVGSTNESFASPASSSRAAAQRSGSGHRSSRGGAATSSAAVSSARLGGPAPLGVKYPPFEPVVVAVSAVAGGGASLVHLWNALLAPSADTQRKLSRLLDAVKRNTRLQAATLIDLHSGLFIASDAGSTARLPNAGQIALADALADVTGPQESHEAVAEFATRAYERGAGGDRGGTSVALGRNGEPVRCSGCLFGSADESRWLDEDAARRAAAEANNSNAASSLAGGGSAAAATRSSRTPKKAHFADDGAAAAAAAAKSSPPPSSAGAVAGPAGPVCLPRGAVVPWRWRSRLQTALQMAVATRAAIPAAAANRTAASDVFEASIGVGDGSVLLVAGLTGEGLALAAAIAAKDAGNASHVAFNIGILRRTVAEMLAARRGGGGGGGGTGGAGGPAGSGGGGGATGAAAETPTNSGSGWDAPAARPRREGPRAVVVSPRVTPRSTLPSPRLGGAGAGPGRR